MFIASDIPLLLTDSIFYPGLVIIYAFSIYFLSKSVLERFCSHSFEKKEKITPEEALGFFKSALWRIIVVISILVTLTVLAIHIKNKILNPPQRPIVNRAQQREIEGIRNHEEQPLKVRVYPSHDEKLDNYDQKMEKEAQKIKERNNLD
ncbi:MAG: hypothetical protein ACOC80_15130 [Petrotogales bacterium]